jgi:signal transduction histidine kinase
MTTATALRAHDLKGLGSTVALERASTIGDQELLERLVDNLVSNAIRHNIVGGWIEVATRPRSGHAVLSVANTGPQIPTSELRRLFQPFHRPLPRPPDGAAGAGLGLAIVLTIAAAHDAKVVARAQPHGGLRIDIRFPAVARTGALSPRGPQTRRLSAV